ncbi:MAG: SDR family oxidoreductase [Candidatus Hydrogenedentes bacterium]|nr:SDR family oxidoreductase [Candidatus Hydrogenedentota bacterium]
MKILVAGGAGYVGSVLVPLLQEHGYEVVVVDTLWFGNHLPEDTQVHQKNLFELREEDLIGYSCVIFLAGMSNDPMAEYSPALNFIENASLPSYLAFIAKKAGVGRFIYASSCTVYGYAVNELYDEECPATCGFPYGISKLQGEHGVIQMQDESFSTISLRQGTVCGYSPRMRFDLIVNTMYKAAILEGRITVNNPSIWRPILDVRDTATAFLRAVQAAPSISGVFNVAYDNFTVGQIGDLVKDAVEELTGQRVQITVKDMQDFRNYKVTCAKAKTTLGFAPKYDVTDMVKSLHNKRATYGDFADDLFYNIVTFKKVEKKLWA